MVIIARFVRNQLNFLNNIWKKIQTYCTNYFEKRVSVVGFIQGGFLERCICILKLLQMSKGYLPWLEFYPTPSDLILLLLVQRISFRNCPITELFLSLEKRFLGCKMLLYSKAIMGACASFFYVLFLY